MCSTTSPGNNTLYSNNYNNPFLPEFSSSPGWHPVTRTRGVWLCRYRVHWRSGPRHPSPRSRICAQEWHGKDKFALTHSFPSTHAHSENKEQKPQLTKCDAFVELSSSCPKWWWATARKLGRCSSRLLHVRGFSPRTVLTENICRCAQHKLPDNNVFSNNPHNNPFLPGFSSSPGWLLVTRTSGSWWCRYRGHSRSGPRHLSPRSRVCAQEWHCNDIHCGVSLIHPVLASFSSGEFLLHIPCCIYLSVGSFSCTSHAAFFLFSSFLFF